MRGRCWGKLLVLNCFMAAVLPVKGVIFFATADPQHNTSPPTGALAGSGWDLQGDAFPGVPIAPSFFITATHVGGKAGDVFAFHGAEYPMIARYDHPDADITIWKVNGTFPQYATLYPHNDELGKPLVVFGRGTERGEEVRLDGILKGWAWGKSDGILRWGENVVAGISDADGKPTTATTKFELLRADFDPNGGPNEAHLSGGDSGGGVFIQDSDGLWKLAGINHAANFEYSTTQFDQAIDAALFDESGYYEGEAGKREYHPEAPSLYQPGSFFATRLSTYASWIQNILAASDASIHLEEAASLFGPYTPVASAVVDEAAQTITVRCPNETRFYRVAGERPITIIGIVRLGDEVVLSYETL